MGGRAGWGNDRGKEEGWARGRLARGKRCGHTGEGWQEGGWWRGRLVQCQEGCALSHAIALHIMPYIPYIQPLDAQFGVGVKKFGSWPQNLAERRADKI